MHNTVTTTGAQTLQQGRSHSNKARSHSNMGAVTSTEAVIPLVIVYPMHSHYNRSTFAGNGKYLLSEVTMKNYIVIKGHIKYSPPMSSITCSSC